jgi:hypothetical protein
MKKKPVVAEVCREWQARVTAEYHSASFTTELLQLLILLGAPYALLHQAHRIVRDELDHAERSFEVFGKVGGEQSQVVMREDTLRSPQYEPSTFGQAFCINLSCFCIGETMAVPLFREMVRRSSDRRVVGLLHRIVEDESRHREFGWELLDWFLEVAPVPSMQLLEKHAALLLHRYREGYGDGVVLAGTELVGAAEEALGLLPRRVYAAVVRETVEQVVLPRFARRGLVIL